MTCYTSVSGNYLAALSMRDGESSSFSSATQPLNPNNPYSPDGKTHSLCDLYHTKYNSIIETFGKHL